jgi:hypothetical protein
MLFHADLAKLLAFEPSQWEKEAQEIIELKSISTVP